MKTKPFHQCVKKVVGEARIKQGASLARAAFLYKNGSETSVSETVTLKRDARNRDIRAIVSS